MKPTTIRGQLYFEGFMKTSDKKQPTYEDLDLMPFGKYKNLTMADVPASYLAWLWEQRPISDKKLENYIHNSKEAIEQELGRKI